MRLNQFLASAGLGSRRSCETLIQEGRVTVNGKTVQNLATQVKSSDAVTVDGKSVQTEQPLTLILHKPKGVVCSTVPEKGKGRDKTVFDLLPKGKFPRLFYVGRLDADSEGLLLLTNQGNWAQKLAHPKFKLAKTYHVRLNRPFDFDLAPKFTKGFLIQPGFAKMESIFKLGRKEVKVILKQGLKRQIRLMFSKHGYEVVELKRVQIGKLKLGDLKPGQWEVLSKEEQKAIF